LVTEDGLQNQQITIKELYRTDYFGEVGLYHDSFRTATVSSSNYGEVGQISRAMVYKLLETYPALKYMFVKNMLNYRDENRLFLMEVIRRKIPYMAGASE
jgi:hypothetical protein